MLTSKHDVDPVTGPAATIRKKRENGSSKEESVRTEKGLKKRKTKSRDQEQEKFDRQRAGCRCRG